VQLRWDFERAARRGHLITTIDTHTAGEPLRIVVDGLPLLEGATMLERRRLMREHHDAIRRALMWEPRGHFDMYGAILTPPVSPEADLGVLFLHNEGYSTMCGHGVIGLLTALFACGVLEPQGPRTPVNLDTPAGLVRATAHHRPDGTVERVTFVNVPSFVLANDLALDLPGQGKVAVDVCFGGAFYALLPAAHLGLTVEPAQKQQLVAAANAITEAVNASLTIQHPDEAELGFLYGTILTGPAADPAHHSRNICVFAASEVDRSPTGTGVSARLALLAAQSLLAEGETILVESVLGTGSVFSGRVIDHSQVGAYPAVVPEIGGSAALTGMHHFLIDPDDTLGAGFLL
jgi:trans-L-3-hydroxyproline dehydratase